MFKNVAFFIVCFIATQIGFALLFNIKGLL